MSAVLVPTAESGCFINNGSFGLKRVLVWRLEESVESESGLMCGKRPYELSLVERVVVLVPRPRGGF
jgi:hypothetical protein